jgi:hypothetical protein
MSRSCSSTGALISAPLSEKRLHGGMSYSLVAVDERMAQDERETERRRFLNQSRVQVRGTEGSFGLGNGRFQRTKIANSGCTTRRLEESSMQFDDLCQREVPYHARRRYNSSFFFRIRSAAVVKSSPVLASRSITAALARSSAVRPRRSASRRNCSACAGERSMKSFTSLLYRVRPSRPTTPFRGPGAPAAERERSPQYGREAGRTRERSGTIG